MSLLPLPSRLPARKHVMAAVFGLIGLGLMVAAVLSASGISSPFRAGGPESVRTGAVLVNEPTTTTEVAVAAASVVGTERTRAVAPVPQAPVSSAPRTTTPTSKAAPTTTTTSPLPATPPTTVPSLLGGLGRGLGAG
jgi:hypothetical protein